MAITTKTQATRLPILADLRIGIIGLGYVGLPLAVAFGCQRPVTGYDLKSERVHALRSRRDDTLEVNLADLQAATQLRYTDDPAELADCNCYIVTVPTPVDRYRRPDLTPLKNASRAISRLLKRGDIVIYESTVYPGATEEVCVPILSEQSGLALNHDFWVGYSPERINPGDHTHRLHSIVKVTSGSTPEAAMLIDELYRSIITAGTHRASSIRVAEAAKVIENIQRDVNIALVNELAVLFNRLNIDTQEVLEAAGSKWNFLPFRPGLVGGHCIGVDPYYLTLKAQEVGYHPEIILAGRRINDNVGFYVAAETVRHMVRKRIHVADAKILIMGLTFKENCPDLRNTRVTDILHALQGYGAVVDVHDPWASPAEALKEYGITLLKRLPAGHYDAVIIAVAHQHYQDMGTDAIRALGKDVCVLYDVKSLLPRTAVDGRL